MWAQLTVEAIVLPEASVVVTTEPAPPVVPLVDVPLPLEDPPDTVELLELPDPPVELVLPPIAFPVGDEPPVAAAPPVVVVYVEPCSLVVVMTPTAPPDPEPVVTVAVPLDTVLATVAVPLDTVLATVAVEPLPPLPAAIASEEYSQ